MEHLALQDLLQMPSLPHLSVMKFLPAYRRCLSAKGQCPALPPAPWKRDLAQLLCVK